MDPRARPGAFTVVRAFLKAELHHTSPSRTRRCSASAWVRPRRPAAVATQARQARLVAPACRAEYGGEPLRHRQFIFNQEMARAGHRANFLATGIVGPTQ
jgi:alkylation response protein AidB-like acyl-CoA dehydrogenase